MTQLHIDLLLALRGAGIYGAAAEDLLTDMRRGRHRALTLPELEQSLRDLADRIFAQTFSTAMQKKRWAITGIGAAALQEEGL
ncbi:MAG: hypothetical protein Q8J78_04885 [Moraxellaceae bacterium]|nr:hypothetical protein [Moraxellaceae bacterium]